MNRLSITLIALTLMSGTALADEGGTGLDGGKNNTATASGEYGDGNQAPAPTSAVQWAEERIARLLDQQEDGAEYYGNSKIPIANAIAKARRQLAIFLEAERNGTPYAVPGTPGYTGLGNVKNVPCTGSLYC